MSMLIAAILFAIFAADVIIGSTGGKVFLSDVGEMLMLLGASVFFVVAILKREAIRNKRDGGA
ncbi:hypothetical protein [Brevirhabdus sp.]|uniref:hypothetical protein n=1 Tax=Brevirhabdus sp. TaxID=2004514 RepID=UPI0040584061